MEMKEDKVSIIIPAYNAEAYIKRAITSALDQSYNNIEVLVINDGSVDTTREIVEAMCADNPNICLFNTQNFGVSHARNLGLENATGEWIMFLDADDAIVSDAIQDMLSCMKENDLDIIAAERCCIYEGQEETLPVDSGELVVYRGTEALLRSVEDYPETYSACIKLYKRSAVASVRFPEGRRVAEDSFFCFKCLTQNLTLGVYDKTIYKNYMTPFSATRCGFSEKVFDILALAEEKKEIIATQFPELMEHAKLMMLKAHMALLRNMCKTNEKKYRPIERKSIRFVIQNRNYFKAAIPTDEKWFWIITNHLYWVYKFVYRHKNKM